MQTADSALLHVWKLLPPKERNLGITIIATYGDAGNKSYWLKHSAILSQLGFTIILFDYRGFGKSSEFKIETDKLYYEEFETDLSTIINWTKTFQKNDQIGIWALSMGTIISTQVLPHHDVDFLIAEGYERDPLSLAEEFRIHKNRDFQLPPSASIYTQNLKLINVPMLIFAGDEDQFMTIEDSNEIAGMKENRKLITFEGGHMQGFRALTGTWFGEHYVKKILNFTASL